MAQEKNAFYLAKPQVLGLGFPALLLWNALILKLYSMFSIFF